MRRATSSLALRLALATGLWVALSLGVAGWFVIDSVVRQVSGAFDARLITHLDGLTAMLAADDQGHVVLTRTPTAPEFDRPLSGSYWQLSQAGVVGAASRSLWDQTLPSDPLPADTGLRWRTLSGPREEGLRMVERLVLLPGASAPVQIAVAVSRAALLDDIHHLRAGLSLVLVALGIGVVAGVAVTVIVGLAPLRQVQRALAAVRAGRQDQLGLAAPSEIAPLVAELDAVIAANRATVERARSHVGTLAHALKTPLAVLRNALADTPPDVAQAEQQTAIIDRLVQHHLARARVVALAAPVGTSLVSPRAIAEEVATALRRLFAARGVEITVSGQERCRLRMDAQDLTEVLGNLMENACQWAQQKVVVTVVSQTTHVVITITDDGPGLAPEERRAATHRGVRLDDGVAGAGLGLAIAIDITELYGGAVELLANPAGGLSVRLTIPMR
ncbi:MAG: sensor histidine kinase [Alphaproteobacteria bacterium]|nr:MAG: sensor histidine kinase [Alphaproteobacteria bacterium]